MLRVDDGEVPAGDQFLPLHVQLSWSVAPLTSDCVPSKDRLLVLVNRHGHRQYGVGVTEQALGLDGPIEVVVSTFIPGGKVPPVFLAVPGNRRLIEPAVALDQVREPSPSRPQRKAHLRLDLSDDSPPIIAPRFFVKLPTIASFDCELGEPCHELSDAI
jgi:hypothetical protein